MQNEGWTEKDVLRTDALAPEKRYFDTMSEEKRIAKVAKMGIGSKGSSKGASLL